MLYDKIKKINNFVVENLFILIIVFLLIFFFTRNNNSINKPQYANEMINTSFANDSAPSPMLMSGRAKMSMSASSNQLNSSKIVKSFSLSIEVKNVEKIKNKIENKIAENNGQIDNFYSYTYGNSNQLAYNFNLQILSDKVESLILYFKELGIVKSESSSVVDMQEKYTDNANRLKNLYLRRDRLRKMMENKTNKLSDIIAVDRELSNVQNEIELLEISNKKIDNKVELSSVNLSILPEVKIDKFNNSQWQFSIAWKQAVNDLIIFGQKVVSYGLKITVFSPFIILVIIIVYLLKKKVIK